MTRVKICGITNLTDAAAAIACGADALGFIFAPSPRRISARAAGQIIAKLPPLSVAVGVFVNAPVKDVLSVLKQCRLNVLQFHGEEDDKYCEFFRKYCKIIKAVRIRDKGSLGLLKKYRHADAFLLDSFAPDKYGGTGKVFPVSLLRNKIFPKPVIIAGGINKDNVARIIRAARPYAIDASSSLETRPGKKSSLKMSELIRAVKKSR